jgi:hypothetical protein
MLRKGGGGVAGGKVPAPTGAFSPDRTPSKFYKHTFLYSLTS